MIQPISGDDIVVSRWAGSAYSSKPFLCCVGVVGHLELQCVHGFLARRTSNASRRHSHIDHTDDITASHDCWEMAAVTSAGAG